ncbi:hypothetical protein BJX76DRAFT_49084 [Aspergillus varians]
MDDWVVPNDTYNGPLQQPQVGDQRGVNAPPDGSWPGEQDIFFDWDAFYGSQNFDLGSSQGDRTSWSTLDFLHFDPPSTPLLGGERAFDTPDILNNHEILAQPPVGSTPIVPSGFNNVAEWIDGAYRPATPCDHCRRHRLQCLILRCAPDNPNPVPSCSSCVGLFRPCSFGRGEKRQPSGFETLSPVLGHLHGVIEEADDGDGGLEASCKPDLKETKQFVRKGARVLRDWFYVNEAYPYPSEEEKTILAQETGFSRQRISTWFANARRRHKQQRQVVSDSSAWGFRAGSPMPTSDVASMTPMERWQSSPPDEEPVLEAVIREAMATSPVTSDVSGRHSQVGTPPTDVSSGCEGSSLASSLSSFGILASDASDSGSSAWSFQSGDAPLRSRPYSRRPSVGRRGGRRRIAEDGHYQCTFCTQSFKKKHDWSRHEKSVHLPLDIWICSPNLNELDDTNIPFSECRFCDHQSPNREHWESHDFRECATKPLAERSFSRKDYLWQHLRKFHGCTRCPVPNLDAWRSSPNEIHSRCGFCESHLPSWAARADHLATHFKEGCRMSQWVGDWGFDTAVLARLRNAVLPIERDLLSLAST